MDQPETDRPAGEYSAAGAAEARSPQVIQGGNVDRIRDILFGNQMRDYETRFSRLEENLAKEVNEMRESNRRRMDQIEAYIKKEIEAIQARLRTDRDERTDTAAQHANKLSEVHDTLSRRLRDLDDRGSEVERQLRDQVLQQSKELSDEIRTRHDEMAGLFEKRVGELRHDKVDRTALATLFTEVSLRLNDQFQIPGSDT